MPRATRPAFSSRVINRDRALWVRWTCASGLLNTSLQVGGAVVLAVVTAILGDTTSVRHDQLLPHTHTAIEVVIGVSIAAVVFTVVHLYRTREVAFTRALPA